MSLGLRCEIRGVHDVDDAGTDIDRFDPQVPDFAQPQTGLIYHGDDVYEPPLRERHRRHRCDELGELLLREVLHLRFARLRLLDRKERVDVNTPPSTCLPVCTLQVTVACASGVR